MQKQGQILFEKKGYALFLCGMLSFIPFGAWFSWVIIALMTLRKGAAHGFKFLILGLIACFLVMQVNKSSVDGGLALAVIYLGVYAQALILRRTASWQIVAISALSASLIALITISYLYPHYVMAEFNQMIALLSNIEGGDLVISLTNNQNQQQLSIFAHYILGIKIFSMTSSMISALLFARYMQSLIFYPGAFKKEILAFRANRLVVALMALAIGGAYQANHLAVSALPILVMYLMMAGFCLSLNFIRRRKGMSALIFLFLPLIVIPYVMLPLFVCFGSLDSMFNFRMRLLSEASDEKGV